VKKSQFLPGQPFELGPGAEFDRIRGIARVLGKHGAGIGDDCGLVREGDEFFAFSTDVSVEQVHFRTDWITLEEVGWRATAAALSDLAADGAIPAGVLSAVVTPVDAPESDLLQLMEGVRAAAESVHAPVLGGDLSSGPLWSVTVTVVGRTRAPISRGGAEPGDRLWVTGSLGGARTAVEYWRRGEEPAPDARAAYAHPEPRIDAGRWLARHGAHAMIDLSDGLAGDAKHIAAASAVALDIDLAALPIHPEVPGAARRRGVPPAQFAAEGGEDYELLVALPQRFDAAALFAAECGIALTPIGSVLDGNGASFRHNGRPIPLAGFNHFG
jgi:thiamine-monophosphate kinase